MFKHTKINVLIPNKMLIKYNYQIISFIKNLNFWVINSKTGGCTINAMYLYTFKVVQDLGDDGRSFV